MIGATMIGQRMIGMGQWYVVSGGGGGSILPFMMAYH